MSDVNNRQFIERDSYFGIVSKRLEGEAIPVKQEKDKENG